VTWPVLVFWCVLLWGVFGSWQVLIYLFFASAAFGSLAVVPVEAAGGVNLLPQAVCAGVIVLRALLNPQMLRWALAAMLDLRSLGLLMLFLVVSVLVTMFAPRIFAGTVDVVSISGVSAGPQPLAPGSYNFTQALYLCLSVGVVVMFSVLSEHFDFEAVMRRAFLLGGVVLSLSALVAMAADAAGASYLLDPFRTVSYNLFTDVESLGTRRLVGLMPEASSFGGLSLLYATGLAFLYPAYSGRSRGLAAITASALLVMSALSTSSTAYVGLGVCAGLLALNWLRRLRSPSVRWRSSLATGFIGLTVVATVVLGIILFQPSLSDHVHDMVDLMLFQKSTSESYIERMNWNQTAVDGFLATSGFGVGLGSARASNWFVALLSNTGALGAALMLGFIVQIFARRAPAGNSSRAELLLALKATLLISLVLSALAGTSADFGVGVAALYGLINGFGHDPAPERRATLVAGY